MRMLQLETKYYKQIHKPILQSKKSQLRKAYCPLNNPFLGGGRWHYNKNENF